MNSKNRVKNHGAYPSSKLDESRLYLNDFASRLIGIADDDYIDARALYRNGRYRGFVYHACQAVEKYLKGILLYLEVKVPTTHNLETLLEKVSEVSFIELHDKSIKFLKDINGMDEAVRYDHISYYIRYDLLHELDYFVRDIRPYCRNRCVSDEFFGTQHENQWLRIMSGHDFSTPKIIVSGKLEKLIRSENKRDKISRKILIWNNPYFYSVKRNHFSVVRGSVSRNLYPFVPFNEKNLKLYKYISKYFQFHKMVMKEAQEFEENKDK